jgi:alkylation response protein AidB-like acyl-CoA dehydrogenase
VPRLRSTLQHVARTQGSSLSLPGAGRTFDRFEALAKWAAQDLSLGRLSEGHFDALAILAEAGKEPVDPTATYGVWAARSSTGGTTARQEPEGWYVTGQKAFCSGSGLLDRALVTADAADGYRLFDIDLATQVVSADPDSWPAVGMADSRSETLAFGGPAVPLAGAVGVPGFYLDRPGFWHGAIGVAACWYGGALGLVTNLLRTLAPDSGDPVVGEVGYAVAHIGAMRRVLAAAADEIDEDPLDKRERARTNAFVVRHAVQSGARQVLDHVAAAGGARPLCYDRDQGRRAADLYVYLAQHHGPQDAVALGRSALRGLPWC